MAIPTRLERYIVKSASALYQGAGTNDIIETPNGAIYLFYIDTANDPAYIKSLDGGKSWETAVVLKNIACTQLSVWYDRWSNINGGLIHCAYTDSGTDDVYYRSVDTENSDTLSAETVIYAGTSTDSGGTLSITRARGGNIGVIGCIDAGVEYYFKISTDVGATWTAKTDAYEATQDQCILLPGWAADNQDLMLIYWDADANEISRKLFDDSGNSWSETSIATSMVDVVATSTYPHFNAVVDINNSQNIVIAWSAVDTAGAVLKCFSVTEAAITALTDVVSSSSDDQGLCTISIDNATQNWTVFYGGNSSGTEVFASNICLYSKTSTDQGSTWSDETQVSLTLLNTQSIFSIPLVYKNSGWLYYISGGYLTYNCPLAIPKANLILGI